MSDGGLGVVAGIALVVAGFTLLLVPWSCEQPTDVARCVERCETLPRGCAFDKTHGAMKGSRRFCVCSCEWPLPLTPLDAGAER